MGVLSLAAALVLAALKDSIVFFNSPSDVVEKHIAPGTRIRLGGLVQPGSVLRDSTNVRFEMTDGHNDSGSLYWHSARPIPRGAGRRR
jgi:cytochrome c-type biogenesis protein CcmE